MPEREHLIVSGAQCRLKIVSVVELENATVRHDLPPGVRTDYAVILFRTPTRTFIICRRRRLCKYGATSIFGEPPSRSSAAGHGSTIG
jgi:hypothetical protein